MNPNELPLVSICIPTYNGEAYIAEALQSACHQTYRPLEIVVSDDASNDRTLAIIQQFPIPADIPIQVHQHQPKGIGANWNHCVQQAHGDYIKFLFQDDILLPDCITKMMGMMSQHPKVGMVYCRRSFLYDALTPKRKAFIDYYGHLHSHWDLTIKEGVLSGKSYLKDAQLLNSPKNKIGEPTAVLLKKACFEQVGYFDETLQQALDCEFWYRIMTQYHIGFVERALVQFRLHDEQASIKNKANQAKEQTLLFRAYYNNLYSYLHPKNRWKLLKLCHPIVKHLVSLKNKFYD